MIRKLCLRLSEKKTQTSVAKSKDFQDNEMFKQGQWECFRKVKDFILILMSIKEIYVWNLARFISHCSIFWSAMHCIVSFYLNLNDSRTVGTDYGNVGGCLDWLNRLQYVQRAHIFLLSWPWYLKFRQPWIQRANQ